MNSTDKFLEEDPPGHRYYYLVAMLFITTLVVSNTIAVKIISVGSYAVAAGIICFPIAYIFGDVLTEVYGFKKTKSVIWGGVFCLALAVLLYYIATQLTPAPFYKNEEAFDSIFSLVPRIALGSLAGYLVGSFLNSIVMSKLKVKTQGKMLWLRTISSTIVGELGDSLIFALIAFYGILSFEQLILVGITGFFLKTMYEIIATPITYVIVNWLKKAEGIDVFDYDVKYRVMP